MSNKILLNNSRTIDMAPQQVVVVMTREKSKIHLNDIFVGATNIRCCKVRLVAIESSPINALPIKVTSNFRLPRVLYEQNSSFGFWVLGDNFDKECYSTPNSILGSFEVDLGGVHRAIFEFTTFDNREDLTFL